MKTFSREKKTGKKFGGSEIICNFAACYGTNNSGVDWI
jgi:hypothetical protein